MELAEVASDVVAPAVRSVFKPGEVSAITLDLSDDPAGSVEFSLTAQGETFHYPVIQGNVPNMSAEDWSENLRSLLADWVAETRFGWGQNRDVRWPPTTPLGDHLDE